MPRLKTGWPSRSTLHSRLQINLLRRILNLALRSATLVTRFFFIIALAKFLSPDQVGTFGLVAAIITYAIFFVGLDFYAYSNREILRKNKIKLGRILKAQLALSGYMYMVILPAVIIFLIWTEFPGELVMFCAPLLILEHLNQEIYRLLIALSRNITASLLLFVRQGSWALVAVALMTAFPNMRNVETILFLWALAGVIAASIGACAIFRLGVEGWREAIDWDIIRKGLRISSGMLVGTIALRSVQTFDRYWLEAMGGLELVGAYVVFMSISGTLIVFLDAAIFSFIYPKLISYRKLGQREAASRLLRASFYQTIISSITFGVCCVFVMPVLLEWVEKEVYTEYFHVFYWILFSTFINAISLVPHYGLYCGGHDKPIIFSHIMGLCAFILSTVFLIDRFSELAIPVGLSSAFLTILVIKTGALYSLENISIRPS